MPTFSTSSNSSAISSISRYNKWFHALYGEDGVLTLERIVLELSNKGLHSGRRAPEPNITSDTFTATKRNSALTAYNAEQAGMAYLMVSTHNYQSFDRIMGDNPIPLNEQPKMDAGITVNRKEFTTLQCTGLHNNGVGMYHKLFLLGSRLTALSGQFRWTVWSQNGRYWNMENATDGWVGGCWVNGLPEKYTDENGKTPDWAEPRPWYFYAAELAKNQQENLKAFRANPAKPEWTIYDLIIPEDLQPAFWFGARKQLAYRAGFTPEQFFGFYKERGLETPRPFVEYDEALRDF